MKHSGYTLIELLVVISIIGILGLVAFVNYRNFSQDQILNKGIGQIQTILRLAQANATSGALCGNNGGVKWTVKFSNSDQTRVDLVCSDTKTVNMYYLENLRISAITSSSCLSDTYPAASVLVNYAALSGKMDFSGDDCVNGNQSVTSPTLTINIVSTVNDNHKQLILTKGGSISVQ